jgi:hypothetical protein
MTDDWQPMDTAPRDGSPFDVKCETATGSRPVVENVHYGHRPMNKTKMILWGEKNFLSPYFTPIAWRPCRSKEEKAAANERGDELLCSGGCGRRYSLGPDLVVSDADWAKIEPKGGGFLCPNCMNDAFERLGAPAGSIKAAFTSGPFADFDWKKPDGVQAPAGGDDQWDTAQGGER